TAPADFRIAGDTTGEACVTGVFGVYWSRLFTAESGVSGTYGGLDTAETEAVYNALAKVEDSSYFMLGQKKSTFSGFFPIYWERCSTVHGRAVTVLSTK
ncbi:MAG: hypothetical protein KDK33_19175, partial [Leptospiraceae bacterium]|nr:hypothetical protein [Leptospiraceae bacterium]